MPPSRYWRFGSPPHARGRDPERGQGPRPCRFTPAGAGKGTGTAPGPIRLLVHPRMRGEGDLSVIGSNISYGSPPHARGRGPLFGKCQRQVRFTPACAGKGRRRPRPRASSPVHPRMRGEGGVPTGSEASPDGSPPHARGRVGAFASNKWVGRFTPACAGKGRAPDTPPGSGPVHPRMRGEGTRNNGDRRGGAGSPPHARGRERQAVLDLDEGRFTPACAGKGWAGSSGLGVPAVHPRMRGEGAGAVSCTIRQTGSPPHARGRVGGAAGLSGRRRFTPACAGKGRIAWTAFRLSSVHPRMRGEGCPASMRDATTSGSPPHARGRGFDDQGVLPAYRFTPACAGKGRSAAPSASTAAVHPRMRGEGPAWRRRRHPPAGSPPHARGRVRLTNAKVLGQRFTPACAGKGSRASSPARSPAVHPRMRGEGVSRTGSAVTPSGSPPHARGRAAAFPDRRLPARFTPACAGKGNSRATTS